MNLKLNPTQVAIVRTLIGYHSSNDFLNYGKKSAFYKLSERHFDDSANTCATVGEIYDAYQNLKDQVGL